MLLLLLARIGWQPSCCQVASTQRSRLYGPWHQAAIAVQQPSLISLPTVCRHESVPETTIMVHSSQLDTTKYARTHVQGTKITYY